MASKSAGVKGEMGIYRITIPSGKCYIGSAISFVGRRKTHERDLTRGEHHNSPLQNAANKYGMHQLIFEPIFCVLDKCDLLVCEQEFIDSIKPELNVATNAGSILGYKFTAKQLADRSMRMGEVMNQDSVRAKLSESMKRLHADPEYRAKRAAAIRSAMTDYNKSKSGVRVTTNGNTTEHQSVRYAFDELGIHDMPGVHFGVHQRFRAKLKVEKVKTYTSPNGTEYVFEVILAR